jgi:hypothetical protein
MKTKTLLETIAAGFLLLLLASGCYFPHAGLEAQWEPELAVGVELPKDLLSSAPKKDYTAVIELNYIEETDFTFEKTYRFKLKDLDRKKGDIKLKGLPVGDLTLTLSIGCNDKGFWVVEYTGTSEPFAIRARKQAKVMITLVPLAA